MKIVRTSEVIQKSPVAGASGAIVHGKSLTTATWTFKKGVALPSHHHPHEQITVVVEGTVELTVDGKTHTLTAGDHAVIPGDVEHAATAVTDATVIDAFHPVREDLQ